MSLFSTLDREKRSILRKIDSIGRTIQEHVQRKNEAKLSKLENELKLLCDDLGIELDDVLSIYL